MVQTKRFRNSVLTNNLRVIRHAWHFYYALVLVIKVVCGSIVLRASHLNWALYVKGNYGESNNNSFTCTDQHVWFYSGS
ncbi:TPA: DUF3265 domain-containing protein [Vibrio parahaemolyticus]|nr:DUF3265 domain-containing protein [Vibrio parahaemolyticus]UPR08188.1 DUF3265 domain-containing protein [Vibrio parahaemolyticus]HAV1530821.1 DUF3265 domain-containing protein [Vibrio parahaemolyticus]